MQEASNALSKLHICSLKKFKFVKLLAVSIVSKSCPYVRLRWKQYKTLSETPKLEEHIAFMLTTIFFLHDSYSENSTFNLETKSAMSKTYLFFAFGKNVFVE